MFTSQLNGDLGSLLEEWTIDTVVRSICEEKKKNGNKGNTADKMTFFWNCLQGQWKEQTVRFYETAQQNNLGLPLTDIHLPSEEYSPFLTDLSVLQYEIANWQRLYHRIETLYLNQTHARTRTVPLTQDFPLEHYAAIFMPLLFPLLVPFLISTVKEFKRWRQKRKKTAAASASTENDNNNSEGIMSSDGDAKSKEKEA
ncbi:MAG: hypothetical protein SGARI_000206 [Bacillariaceae sp.]